MGKDKLKNVWGTIKTNVSNAHSQISSKYGHTAREDRAIQKFKMKQDKDVSGAEAAVTKNTTYSNKKIK